MVLPVGESLVGPSVILESVVVAACQGVVTGAGRSALRLGLGVVGVTVDSRHATPREDAVLVTRFDVSALCGIWASSSCPAAAVLIVLSAIDAPSPLPSLSKVRDLTCDVGDHGSVSGEFASLLGQAGKRVEIYIDVDD